MTTNGIVQKIRNFCHTLRDAGVGYGDYLEQITYLLFLKYCDDSGSTHPIPLSLYRCHDAGRARFITPTKSLNRISKS